MSCSMSLTGTETENQIDYSQPIEIASWLECKDYKLGFGKHQGMTLADIIDLHNLSGLDYFCYLLKWPELSAHTRSYLDFAVKHYMGSLHIEPLEAFNFIMPFGKYKKKSLQEIAVLNQGYIKWLSSIKNKPSISLRAAAITPFIDSLNADVHLPEVKAVSKKKRKIHECSSTEEVSSGGDDDDDDDADASEKTLHLKKPVLVASRTAPITPLKKKKKNKTFQRTRKRPSRFSD